MGCRGGLQWLSHNVNHGIANVFRWEGEFVARRPVLVIIVAALLSAGLGYLGVKNFEEQKNPEELYAPSDAQSKNDREYVRDLYGYPAIQDRILVRAKKGYSQNLLDENQLRSNIKELLRMYSNIRNIKVERSGLIVDYTDVCVKPRPGAPCEVESILDAWSYNRSEVIRDRKLLQTINSGNLTNQFEMPLDLDFVLGGIKRDTNGMIFNAEVFQMALEIDQTLDQAEKRNLDAAEAGNILSGEQQSALAEYDDYINKGLDIRGHILDASLVDLVNGWHKRPGTKLEAYVSSFVNVDRESNEAVRKDLIWLLLGFVLIVGYSHLVLFRNNLAHCKVHLVWASLLSVLMAIASAFGLSLTLGVKFNLVVMSVPFLMLGLGIDDTFIIMGAYKKTDTRKSAVDRIADTMAKAGASIFVTSFTDLVAFLIGMLTDVEALRSFSIYASFGIAFDFLYQVTFFVAFASLEAHRESRMCDGVEFWGLSMKMKTNTSVVSADGSDTIPAHGTRIDTNLEFDDVQHCTDEVCTGDDASSSTLSPRESPSSADVAPPCPVDVAGPMAINVVNRRPSQLRLPLWQRKIFGKGSFNPYEPSLNTRLVGDWLPRATLSPLGKSIVTGVELLLLATAVYGLLQVSSDFRFKDWFTPEGSRMKVAFKIEDEYFYGDQNAFSVYTKEAPKGSSYFDYQDELTEIVKAVQKNDYVAAKPELDSWYEDFSKWLNTSIYMNELDNGRAPNATAFHEWVYFFITEIPQGTFYYSDIKFNDNRTDIISSRIVRAFSKDIVDGDYAIDMMDSLRKAVASPAPDLDPIAYHFMFSFYDGLKVIQWQTLRNVLLAGVAVFVVTLITLASFIAAACAVLMIALTDVMLFGYMWYIGLTFNAVTSINIVIVVGIAVDYSAHVAHSFLNQTGTKTERAKKALENIGGEVFSGGFTTFLAVLSMAPAKHYILNVFFQMFAAIVSFGLWHGIIVLPVLLSFIGPESCDSGSPKEKTRQAARNEPV